jgi:hypothetical protein
VRIIKIGVTVAKIWEKEFHGPICNFWKVPRANLEFIFKKLGVFLAFCGLRLDIV